MRGFVGGFMLAVMLLLGVHLLYPGHVQAQKPLITHGYITRVQGADEVANSLLSVEKTKKGGAFPFPGNAVVGISCVQYKDPAGVGLTVDCYVLSK